MCIRKPTLCNILKFNFSIEIFEEKCYIYIGELFKEINVMSEKRTIEPIAHIYTDFKEKFGLPRQSGCAASLTGKIVFVPKYRNADSLRGLDGYSHIWVIFDFSESHFDDDCWMPTVRPPRLGGNKRVGVFASRSPFRPNSLGLSSLKLEKIERTNNEGTVLYVSGIDILDGTPIYDIKPYLPYTDVHTKATGGYAEKASEHKLRVEFSGKLEKSVPPEKLNAVKECLSQDIRPGYQRNPEKAYSMKFSDMDIRFTVKGDCVTVTEVQSLK